jgi:hypothetical protein
MNVLSIDHMHSLYFDYKITRLTVVISLYYEPNFLIHAKFNENYPFYIFKLSFLQGSNIHKLRENYHQMHCPVHSS